MVFSSPVFLYYFLPLLLALYFLAYKADGNKARLPNAILLLGSLFFYFYGANVYIGILLIVTFFLLHQRPSDQDGVGQ